MKQGKIRQIHEEIKEKVGVKGEIFGVVLLVLLIGGGIFFVKKTVFSEKKAPEIITETSLYDVVNANQLSTYQCVYNDICTVYDKEEPSVAAYYCAYEAKVNAGIDFTQVQIQVEEVDEKLRVIHVTVPKVTIEEPVVDIAKLDYMFMDSDANNSTVSEEAYKACIADVSQKSKTEIKIFNLAQKNAENIIKALIKPFVEQLKTADIRYELDIKSEGGQ